MAVVYILYSKKLDRFYTGSCKEFISRFQDHLNKAYPQSFTAHSDDWQLFLVIEDLAYIQAREIEQHVKKMKSSVYIQNLAKYPGKQNGAFSSP